jgi:hypothetical protein
MDRPTPDEAETLQQLGDWARQAGPGGFPPEMLAILRAYGSRRFADGVKQERERKARGT